MIKDSIEIINNKIRKAELKSGRKEKSVKLMAVSKFHPAEAVLEAIKAGQLLFGENRVQEAMEKFPAIQEEYPQCQLHIIGSLQSNKVKNAVKIASCIESLDRLDLLPHIEKHSAALNKNIKVLLEIHTGEDSKSGFESEDDIRKALAEIEDKYPHIIPAGFMTMAPFTDNQTEIHKAFEKARLIAEKMKSEYHNFDLSELSMGMSGDFEIAIEEGSTLVRVGTAIFGERDYSKK
ncbi:MAG: YggS family pyridoxal phosphate-dependent enzyme [Treponema sp.]|nr:YggS family pyridoxal phosphate-dependent enzyme [Treponema sp.]